MGSSQNSEKIVRAFAREPSALTYFAFRFLKQPLDQRFHYASHFREARQNVHSPKCRGIDDAVAVQFGAVGQSQRER